MKPQEDNLRNRLAVVESLYEHAQAAGPVVYLNELQHDVMANIIGSEFHRVVCTSWSRHRFTYKVTRSKLLPVIEVAREYLHAKTQDAVTTRLKS